MLRALIPGSDLEQKNSANQTPSELANFVGKEELGRSRRSIFSRKR